MVGPQYDESRLRLSYEENAEGHWRFEFRGEDGTVYGIEMEQPQNAPFAVMTTMTRRLPDSGGSRVRPSFARYWPRRRG